MPDGPAPEPAVTRARRSQEEAAAPVGTPAETTDSSRMAAALVSEGASETGPLGNPEAQHESEQAATATESQGSTQEPEAQTTNAGAVPETRPATATPDQARVLSQQVQALRAQRAEEKARLEARLTQLQNDDDDDDEYGVEELINSAPGYSNVQQNAVAFAGDDRSDRVPPLGPDCLHENDCLHNFHRNMPRRSSERGPRRPQPLRPTNEQREQPSSSYPTNESDMMTQLRIAQAMNEFMAKELAARDVGGRGSRPSSRASSRPSSRASSRSGDDRTFADHRPRDLSSGEITARKTDLKPSSIRTWMASIEAHFAAKLIPEIDIIVSGTDEEYRELMETDGTSGRDADAWLASNISMLFDQSSLHVQRLQAEFLEDRELTMSGRSLLKRISMIPRSAPGPERTMRQDDYNRKKFFSQGDSMEATYVNARLLEETKGVLPVNPRDNDLMHSMLEKVPTTNETVKRRVEELKYDLEQTEWTSEPPPWTKSQLISRIAQLMHSAPPAPKTNANWRNWQTHTTELVDDEYEYEAEVDFTESYGRGGGRGSGGKGRGRDGGKGKGKGKGKGTAREIWSTKPGKGRGRDGMCYTCGGDHAVSICEQRCTVKECNEKGCPAAASQKESDCVVKSRKPIPDPLLNREGNPTPGAVRLRLQTKQTAYHGAEINVIECDNDDSELIILSNVSVIESKMGEEPSDCSLIITQNITSANDTDVIEQWFCTYDGQRDGLHDDVIDDDEYEDVPALEPWSDDDDEDVAPIFVKATSVEDPEKTVAKHPKRSDAVDSPSVVNSFVNEWTLVAKKKQAKAMRINYPQGRPMTSEESKSKKGNASEESIMDDFQKGIKRALEANLVERRMYEKKFAPAEHEYAPQITICNEDEPNVDVPKLMRQMTNDDEPSAPKAKKASAGKLKKASMLNEKIKEREAKKTETHRLLSDRVRLAEHRAAVCEGARMGRVIVHQASSQKISSKLLKTAVEANYAMSNDEVEAMSMTDKVDSLVVMRAKITIARLTASYIPRSRRNREANPVERVSREANLLDQEANPIEKDENSVEFLIDGGANLNLVKDEAVRDASEVVAEVTNGDVMGVSLNASKNLVQQTIFTLLYHPNLKSQSLQIEAGYAPSTRRNVMSESWMWDHFGAQTFKEPRMEIRFPQEEFVPIYRRNGLYLATFFMRAPEVHTMEVCEAERADSAEPAHASDDGSYIARITRKSNFEARLLAARMNVNSLGLRSVLGAIDNPPMQHLTAGMREAIDADVIVKRSMLKRQHVPRLPMRNTTYGMGEYYIMDAWGPTRVPSPVDKAQYHLTAIDAHENGYTHDAGCRALGVETFIAFVRHIKAEEHKHGHILRVVRIDATPEIKQGAFTQMTQECAKMVPPVSIERGAGNHHQGTAKIEALTDWITRWGEGMCARAGKGRAWILPARQMSMQIRLLRPSKSDASKTRIEAHTGKRPDAQRTLIPLFGTTVAYVADEQDRDGKGSLDSRSPQGFICGITAGKLRIHKTNGQTIDRSRYQLKPVNEEMLLDRGLPFLQEDEDDEEEKDYLIRPGEAARTGEGDRMSPNARAPALAKPKPPKRIPVYYVPPEAYPQHQSPHPAGWRVSIVREDRGWKYCKYHDKTADGGAWESIWRKTKDLNKLDQGGEPWDNRGAQQVGQKRPPLTRLAARARAEVLHSAANQALSSTLSGGEAAATWNAMAFQVFGDQSERFEVNSADEVGEKIEEACMHIERYATSTEAPEANSIEVSLNEIGPECNKAAANYFTIKSTTGRETVIHVPSSPRQVFDDPHREEWLAATEKALRVVILQRNRLVRRDSVPAGALIYPCVTVHKVKVNKKTQTLDPHDAFKVRLSADAPRGLRMCGVAAPTRGEHAVMADDQLLKMELADAALYDMDLLTADLPNAYNKGERLRPKAYMLLPETTDHCGRYDEDGHEMVLELNTPMYGEESAGDETDKTICEDFEHFGWVEAEGVPALHTMVIEPGVGPRGVARLIRIVDDFLLLTPPTPAGRKMSGEWTEHLERHFGPGVKVKLQSCECVGYVWVRDRTKGAITVTMTSHVEALVERHCPGLKNGTYRPSKDPKVIVTGETLAKLADGLKLPQERTLRLSKEQKQVQEIIGGLKYPEKILPRITLPVHRLSSVMSYPCERAFDVAMLTLELAWDHRLEGITYGGDGPGCEETLEIRLHANFDMSQPGSALLEAYADATWGNEKDVYGYVVMCNRGAVAHGTKRLASTNGATVGASSAETEGVATSAVANLVVYGREIQRAHHAGSTPPSWIGSDSQSSMQIAARKASAARARHILRRWHILTQRMRAGQVQLLKVDTDEMPADMLTKFLPKAKIDKSIIFITNSTNQVKAT